MATEILAKNPRRVEAGRRNGPLRRPRTLDELQALRELCLATEPWKASTGPRTPAGKARSAANGWRNKPNPESLRQLKAEMADTNGFVAIMASLRRQVTGAVSRS